MVRVRVRHDDLTKRLSHCIERRSDRVQVSGSPDARVDQRGHLPGQQPGVVAGPGEWARISGIQSHQPR